MGYHIKPCVPYVNLGLYSPVEFLTTRAGDCDTRVLWACLVLKKLGYDVAVLISEKYGHAMLGGNMNGRGKYLKYKNKKYLFWELHNLVAMAGC